MSNGKYTTQLDSIFALDSLAAISQEDSIRMEWDKLDSTTQADYGSFSGYKDLGTATYTETDDNTLTAVNAIDLLSQNIPANISAVTDTPSVVPTSDLGNVVDIRAGKDEISKTNTIFNKAYKGFGLFPVSEKLQTNLMPAIGIGTAELASRGYTTLKTRLGEGGFFQKTGRANVGLFKNLLAYDLAMHSQGLIYNYLKDVEIEHGDKNIKFGEESYAPAIGSGVGAWAVYRGARWGSDKVSNVAKNVSKLVLNNMKTGRGAYLYDKAMTAAVDDAVLRMTGRGPIPNYMHKQNVDRARAKAEKKIFRQLGKELGFKKRDMLKKILKNIGENTMGKGMAIGKFLTKKSPWLGGKIISLAGLGAAGKLFPSWVTQGASAGMNILLANDIFNLAMTDKTIQNILGLEVSDIPSQENALIDEMIRKEKFSLDPNDPFFAPETTYGPQLPLKNQ